MPNDSRAWLRVCNFFPTAFILAFQDLWSFHFFETFFFLKKRGGLSLFRYCTWLFSGRAGHLQTGRQSQAPPSNRRHTVHDCSYVHAQHIFPTRKLYFGREKFGAKPPTPVRLYSWGQGRGGPSKLGTLALSPRFGRPVTNPFPWPRPVLQRAQTDKIVPDRLTIQPRTLILVLFSYPISNFLLSIGSAKVHLPWRWWETRSTKTDPFTAPPSGLFSSFIICERGATHTIVLFSCKPHPGNVSNSINFLNSSFARVTDQRLSSSLPLVALALSNRLVGHSDNTKLRNSTLSPRH